MLDTTYTYSAPEFQMVSGEFDTLSHIMEIYFSESDESNVSDDISEALMRNVIANLRAAIKNPNDYTISINLVHDVSTAENRDKPISHTIVLLRYLYRRRAIFYPGATYKHCLYSQILGTSFVHSAEKSEQIGRAHV